jgi:cellulose synthase/poly-beta-1,6-N-acetylglucosamine synthase-like glycosyltransferase
MPVACQNKPSPAFVPAPIDVPREPALAPAIESGHGPTRPQVRGKFLFVGTEKFYVRGVTYGPFRPGPDGCEYHDPPAVERDFALMAVNGINSVRVYSVPPRWLLDTAQRLGLFVLVGLPWEQHVAFLDHARQARDLERRVRNAVRSCDRHPAILAYSIGNEIPSPIVRWYGHRRVEAFLERLYWAVREEDPGGLVTYVNYPSTEYLELPFLDFVSFNVYLESQERLQAYVARLQNIAGERPLVMAELGLDSLGHGEAAQARSLEWQARTIFANGCAGLFVFSWTDEWHRGGHDIDGWQFGLTTIDREPRPALEAVRQVFQQLPFPVDDSWPFISVAVCSYNGSRTIRQSLEGLRRMSYPKFEVIVVDDGSTDTTAAIAGEYDVRLVRTANQGLSAARNLGWQTARGEIVAYLDDDASPDAHWLHYLAAVFVAGRFAGVGGPNIAFPDDGFVAECVDHAPGNPTHVLLTDREAEHLPGCNMAYRRECLEAIGGFDSQFRIAGDDVDLCWRLQENGWKLGFHPGAMVWHHRRPSVRAYWRQQVNYGRAEAMLERKWPEKYNAVGHLTWSGRLYGKGFWQMFKWTQRIYHGSWGRALFQSVYSLAPGRFGTFLMMPEWYLALALLSVMSLCSAFYEPLRFSLGLMAFAFVPPAAHAWLCGQRNFFRVEPRRRRLRWRFAALTAVLNFLQPAARLSGRLRQGLTPWRRRGADRMIFPWPRIVAIWSEKNWRGPEERLKALESVMRESGAVVVHGGDYDAWDLEVRGGMLGNARAALVIEEHGDGRQLVRLRAGPMGLPVALVVSSLFAILACVAIADLNWLAWVLFNIPALFLFLRTVYEAGIAMAVIMSAIPATLADDERILEDPKSDERPGISN